MEQGHLLTDKDSQPNKVFHYISLESLAGKSWFQELRILITLSLSVTKGLLNLEKWNELNFRHKI